MPEFKEAPIDNSKYTFGEPVTRDNFLDMIKNSFAVSRGVGQVQFMYIEYIRRRNNLGQWDPEKIKEKNEYDLFSSEELKPLHDAYMRVTAPNAHGRYLEPNEEFFQTCIEQATFFFNNQLDEQKYSLNKKEFLEYLSEYAVKEREKKAEQRAKKY